MSPQLNSERVQAPLSRGLTVAHWHLPASQSHSVLVVVQASLNLTVKHTINSDDYFHRSVNSAHLYRPILVFFFKESRVQTPRSSINTRERQASPIYYSGRLVSSLKQQSHLSCTTQTIPDHNFNCNGVVLRSSIGAQILVCKISPLVTVTVTVTDISKTGRFQ